MVKKHGKFTQPEKTEEQIKLHVKAQGKTIRVTFILPEEVVRKIFPQMKRFYEASDKPRSPAKD
jgi:hypothetical protein